MTNTKLIDLMVVPVHKTKEVTILITQTKEQVLINKIAEKAKIESAFDFCGGKNIFQSIKYINNFFMLIFS